ncbi:hypothetical protein J4E85_008012 [Alternaria conjuncta]|uniref:uncharacterized protein n=1 Tax=Alternaria conjuncta TaxID=181017 RepID=UPI00221E9A56|nr:uncharacterized protein J4E85_008012 [Alternaria conjuncta]KAI4923855.1 hypothetical protein J4E85_008012 [Alternaria conjuncta]
MSDSPKTPDALKKALPSNPRLEIPRPLFQRETTAVDPSEWQAYTPKTSHGFIAMHTSTPEDMHENRGNGTPTAVKDYFSVPKKKHNPILSPNPAPYEPHGFLPLCSVAAVEVDTTDYFGPSDMTGKSDIGSASCAAPGMAKDVECNDARLLESHYSERDVAPKPEEEQGAAKEPEVGLRGGSGEELCDGDKETVDHPPAGDVPDPRHHQRTVEANSAIALSPTEIAQKDYTEEWNPVPALNRALEQMLQEVATVCNLALEMNVAANVPPSTEDAVDNTSECDDAETPSQLPTDRSDDSDSAHVA